MQCWVLMLYPQLGESALLLGIVLLGSSKLNALHSWDCRRRQEPLLKGHPCSHQEDNSEVCSHFQARRSCQKQRGYHLPRFHCWVSQLRPSQVWYRQNLLQG